MSAPSLSIHKVLSMPFGENTYLAHFEGANECVVIDPGLEPEKTQEVIDSHGLAPVAILCTHGHADHIGGNTALAERYPDIPIVIGQEDAPMLEDPELNLSAQFGLPITSPPASQLVSGGDTLSYAGINLKVRDAPGHCQGHVVFVYSDGDVPIVFGGDVLMQGSIGRTDFPGGDFATLKKSIEREFYSLQDDTLVLPGHGNPTTVGEEKQSNPFVGLNARTHYS